MTDLRMIDVAVALVADPADKLLVVFNDHWGAFTLPMTKPRVRDAGVEPADAAALRAAAEAVGVPVEPVGRPLPQPVREWHQSGRDGQVRNYRFHLRRVAPHLRFADRLQVRRPHFWASAYALLDPAEYRPMAAMVPSLVAAAVAGLGVPERTAATTTLLVTRPGPTGLEFLLRWNPRWRRWALPAGPRELTDSRPAAGQAAAVAATDLGPAAAALPWAAHADEVELDGVGSGNLDPKLFDVPTRYRHRVARATWPADAAFASGQPLHWATADELDQGYTAGMRPPAGATAGEPGPVSRTARAVAGGVGLLADARRHDDAVRAVIADWFG